MKILTITLLGISTFFSAYTYSSEELLSTILTPQGDIDSNRTNKVIVKEYYDAISSNDQKKLGGILASQYSLIDSTLTFDTEYSRFDAFSRNISIRMKALHEALPEFILDIVHLLSDGNKVFAQIQIKGVQRGSFLGIEATNKPVNIKMFTIFTLDGGKIVHINEMWNELGVMKQLGYIAL